MKFLIPILLLFGSISSASVSASRGFPGEIFMWGGSSCPAHSLRTDGASYLRAGTYSNLFAAISTANGTADGTHFNVPDTRGKFTRDVDGSASNDPDHGTRTTCATGGASGNNVGSCQVDQFKSHTHDITQSAGQYAGASPFTRFATDGTGAFGFVANMTSNATGGNQTNPVNVYVLYCIWY